MLIDDCAQLIAEEGRDMTLKRVASGAYADGKATVTATSYSIRGFVLNYKDKDRDGTLVHAGDRKAIIQAKDLAVEPLPNDIIVIDNREFNVIDARKVEQRGESVVFSCQIRG